MWSLCRQGMHPCHNQPPPSSNDVAPTDASVQPSRRDGIQDRPRRENLRSHPTRSPSFRLSWLPSPLFSSFSRSLSDVFQSYTGFLPNRLRSQTLWVKKNTNCRHPHMSALPTVTQSVRQVMRLPLFLPHSSPPRRDSLAERYADEGFHSLGSFVAQATLSNEGGSYVASLSSRASAESSTSISSRCVSWMKPSCTAWSMKRIRWSK